MSKKEKPSMSSNINSGTIAFVPDLSSSDGEYPFETPAVQIEGVAEYYYPQVFFDWDRMSVNISTEDQVIELHRFSYSELQRFDEDGNEIWENGMNAPYEDETKGIVYTGRTRPGETFKLEVTDPKSGKKRIYKCVLERTEGPELEGEESNENSSEWVYPGPNSREGDDTSSLIIPQGVTEIGEAACMEADSLLFVRLPKSLRKIGMCAFLRTGLKEVTLPARLQEIGIGAFAECESLAAVYFEKGCQVKDIPAGAFGKCPALATLLLQGDMEIEPYVFEEDDNLTSIFVECGPEQTSDSIKRFASSFPKATLYFYAPEGPLKDVPSWRYVFDQPGPVPW